MVDTRHISKEADQQVKDLAQKYRRGDSAAASRALAKESDEVISAVLQRLPSPKVLDLLKRLPKERVEAIKSGAEDHKRKQWAVNEEYPIDTIGRAMELPRATMAPEITVAEATERLRQIVKEVFVTYVFVIEDDGRLIGVVVMRDLLLAGADQTLSDIMLREPFSFSPEMSVGDAMKEGVARHFPVYPVCDEQEKLVGLIRGENLYEQNVFDIVVQAGSMVGVEKEERASTPWPRSLKMRHPWLQINLLTAFIAGAVVGLFEETIEQIVILAVFLPVLAGQSGNTGCQALAVTLRGLTLGELTENKPFRAVSKEGFLGLLNGAIVGLVAGGVMYWYALNTGSQNAMTLGLVVVLAMVGSCIASGIFGTLIPLFLKKFGADPATASSIFLTTATDVISMGMLLGLAKMLIL